MTSSYRNFLSEDRPGTLSLGEARTALLDIEAGFWALRHQMEALVGRRLADGMWQQVGADVGASFARAFAAGVTQDAVPQALRDCVAACQAAGFGRFKVEVLEWPLGRIVIHGDDTLETWAASQHGQVAKSPVCAYTAGVLIGFVNALAGRQDMVCIEQACQALGDEACLFELLPIESAPNAPVITFDPDPSQELLKQSEASFRSLLENTWGFGVYQVAVDLENPYQGKVILASPSLREILGIEDPYRFESWFENVHPEDSPRIVEANQRSLERGEPFDQSGRFYNAQKQEWIWFRTISNPVFDDSGNLIHFNGLIIDVTEQKQVEKALQASYQTLELRVEERTREIERRRRAAEGLRDILATLNSEQPHEEILKHIVSQANHLLDSDACLIYRLEQNNRWMVMESEYGLPSDYKALSAGPIYPTTIAQAILNRKPAAIADLPAYATEKTAEDDGLAEFHRRWFEAAAKHFRSAMGVPLIVKDTLYGGMVFYYRDQREFSEEDFRLGSMLGDQAALAIENSRLRAQAELVAVVKERERLARELHDSVTQSLYSVTLLSEAGRQLVKTGDLARVGGYLERLGEISQQALREMRLLVYELRPLVLRREGLVGALQQRLDAVEKRAGVDVRLLVEGEVELPGPVEEALYRIAQEALNNALKHAGASNITVCVRSRDDRVELEVIDDGDGFNLSAAGEGGGLGLTSMRERAEKIGGVLDILSAPGEGTRVKACVKRKS